MELCIGERIHLRKAHPCGSSEWIIKRTGMDFRIQCLGCAHETWISRSKLERFIILFPEEKKESES